MQNKIKLSELADVDITAVNKEDLVDVSGLTFFDTTIPREQRAAQVLRKVKKSVLLSGGRYGRKTGISG